MSAKQETRPGRVDGHNAEYRSGQVTIPPALRRELVEVFREHVTKGAKKDKQVGGKTIEKRKEVILNFFSDLYRLKYKIKSVQHLKQKHLIAVFTALEREGQAPATLQNKISIIRVFCGWIGKPGMVKDADRYVRNPLSTQRSMVAQEDKSWEGHGLDVLAKLAEIEKEDVMAAGVLLLCYGFGLRIREAVLLNAFKAEDDGSLKIVHGTKGGRARSVAIEHHWQRELWAKIKKMVDQRTGKFASRGSKLESSIQHVYYIMKKHKLTLADLGVSAHGLRHQYFHERFYELMGIPAPVKGGDLSGVDKQQLEATAGMLMERGGHSRMTIGASYYGSLTVPATPAN